MMNINQISRLRKNIYQIIVCSLVAITLVLVNTSVHGAKKKPVLIQEKAEESIESIVLVLEGLLTSVFGERKDPVSGKKRWHSGIDISAKEGTDVMAIDEGVVIFSGERGKYGNLLEIKHSNGLLTRYGHNKELLVEVGDVVKKNQPVATIGRTGRATGPHVHLEVHQNGKAVDPFHFFPELKKRFSKKHDFK